MNDKPNRDELMRRYETACDMKQAVKTDVIEAKLAEWLSGITTDVLPFRAATSKEDFHKAARAAWDARVARAAWDAMVAWAARAARAAWDAWDARVARAAWAARAAWDASWNAAIILGALELKDMDTFDKWYPLFEAFEAGLWQYTITDTEIVYLTLPSVKMDNERRLHCDNAPALSFLDASDYYWHGVYVSEQIILQPDTITAQQILDESNAEVRRVMLSRYRHSEQITGELSGEAMWLQDIEFEPQCENQYGAVYMKSFMDDVPLCYVRVVDPSTEQVYWLRIDPRAYDNMAWREPQAAVASTWRKADGSLLFEDWRDYAPVMET